MVFIQKTIAYILFFTIYFVYRDADQCEMFWYLEKFDNENFEKDSKSNLSSRTPTMCTIFSKRSKD